MINKFNITFLFILFLSTISIAQNDVKFEGVIIFDMEMENDGMDPTAASIINDLQTKIYIKGHLNRTEINSPLGNNITITDSKNNSNVNLIDLMGNKYLIRSGSEDIKKQELISNEIIIKYSDEKKQIAGYNCKKADLFHPKEGSISVYYTEEISNSAYDSRFKDLKGLALEYEISQFGVKMIVTAKEVRKEMVDVKLFDIPKGYKETTQDELIKIFEGKN